MAHRDHYHHGNLREALVDAASCLIADGGTAGLSLRKVARHAGVSQAAPYHHFSNKDALLAEVALRGFEDLTNRLRDQSADGEPVERLTNMGRAYIGFALEHPWLYTLMFGPELSPSEIDHPALKAAGGAAFSALVQTVAHGQSTGVFSGDDPGPHSLAIWAQMHGLVSLLMTKMGITEPVSSCDCPMPKELGGVAVDPESMIESSLAFCIAGLTHT